MLCILQHRHRSLCWYHDGLRYGGMLSHAGIVVAREYYGIPAVVGSQQATSKFKHGDTITVDGGSGIATLVSKKE
jgi:phosphoenolpyruvate synthase/pyruvate phosphate dikinase